MTKGTAASHVGLSGGRALSPREDQVMREIAGGETYGEIAHRLGLSEQTIKNQMHAARQKLGARSTIEAFILRGWLRVCP
jgi:DNA-binding NarL/FixJ family response regulator